MMVVQGTIGTLAPGIFPADRCVWSQTPSADGRGYTIENAVYIPGALAEVGGDPANQEHPITDPVLGYIGKSGRFVGLSE